MQTVTGQEKCRLPVVIPGVPGRVERGGTMGVRGGGRGMEHKVKVRLAGRLAGDPNNSSG